MNLIIVQILKAFNFLNIEDFKFITGLGRGLGTFKAFNKFEFKNLQSF